MVILCCCTQAENNKKVIILYNFNTCKMFRSRSVSFVKKSPIAYFVAYLQYLYKDHIYVYIWMSRDFSAHSSIRSRTSWQSSSPAASWQQEGVPQEGGWLLSSGCDEVVMWWFRCGWSSTLSTWCRGSTRGPRPRQGLMMQWRRRHRGRCSVDIPCVVESSIFR